jgi:YidC/Oxa1 family membrane protein insertase
MFGWHSFVEFFATALCALAQVYGGNLGLAIITASIMTRLALLPLTLRMAWHAQAQQKILQDLRHDIAVLQARYRSNPHRLRSELSKLYQDRGVKTIDGLNLLGSSIQLLVGAGLYSAIKRGVGRGGRFLWIRNLAQPDAILAVATGVLTFIVSLVGPHLRQQPRFAITVLPALLSMVLAWRLASGVALYWASSTAVSGLQAFLLRRRNS